MEYHILLMSFNFCCCIAFQHVVMDKGDSVVYGKFDALSS